MSTFNNIGVVGGGVIGSGVAQSLAQSGYSATLVDLSEATQQKARETIYQGARLHHFTRQSSPRLNPDEVTGRITFTTNMDDLASQLMTIIVL